MEALALFRNAVEDQRAIFLEEIGLMIKHNRIYQSRTRKLAVSHVVEDRGLTQSRKDVSMENRKYVNVRRGELAEVCEPFLRFGCFLLGLIVCTSVDQISGVEVVLSKVDA